MRSLAGWILTSLTLTAAIVPSGARSQTILGDVVDDARRPVSAAAVGVFDEQGVLVASGRSDEEGHFRVAAPVSGRYRLHVAHPGYRSVSGGPYDVERGIGLELLVVLHRVPVELDELEVVVGQRAAHLTSTGFYERAAAGVGLFFDGEEIRRRMAGGLVDFMARLPSIEKTTRASPFGPDAVRNPALYYERGAFSCVPALWVDGSLVRNGGTLAEPLRPDDWVSPEDVAAVEFYGGPSTVPMEFARSSACAVLVLWTRRSGRSREEG